jgi:hypothetical protein
MGGSGALPTKFATRCRVAALREPYWNDCVNHAVANAVNAVHSAPLSAYHWQRIRSWKHREIETPTTVASR